MDRAPTYEVGGLRVRLPPSALMKQKKVLVTGSRDWQDIERIREVFTGLLQQFGKNIVVIHGDCRGADKLCAEVARELFDPEPKAYPAKWWAYGNSAGPIRNRQMFIEEHLSEDPINLCIAFHDDLSQSTGTKDCVGCAKRAQVGLLYVTSASFRCWRPEKYAR